MEADFSGWATKNGIKCADGRTIMNGAFKHQDKIKVPLVWQHQYNEPGNILGHAILEHRAEGVYTYAYFNDTEQAKEARILVQHGDIESLSIYANNLTEKAKAVFHGDIREVSLVLSGANPGATIDNVKLQHGATTELIEDEAVIYTGLALEHEAKPEASEEVIEHAGSDKSAEEIFNTLTDEQKNVVYYMMGTVAEVTEGGSAEHSAITDDEKDDDAENTDGDDENDNTNDDGAADDDNIQHSQEDLIMGNVFEQAGGTTVQRPSLTHDQLKTIVADAQKIGSFRDSFLAHAVEYGIENIDFLFPDAKTIADSPEFVSRRMEWVNSILTGTKKSPFSRIKTLSADITHDEARAKGYVKATLKKEEWFGLSKRVTTPTTIYKKQKLDRDDIIDITDLDVVAWLKAEMRVMLDEEIARAVLVGDGREVDDDDKIDETHIRPIAHDDDFYAHKVNVAANVTGDALVEAILRARPFYRGAGNPTMYTTEDILTDLILLKDKMGRRLYGTQSELESALRVKSIVTVPVLEGAKTTAGDLIAILVNISDYTIGADKGGAVSMFDDFDIDYNQYKYLIETRISGTLTKFKSALVISRTTGTLATPAVPTFVPATGVVTIPTTTGVTYKNQETNATLTAGAQTALAAGATLSVVAVPNTGYNFAHNTDADWDFTRPAA